MSKIKGERLNKILKDYHVTKTQFAEMTGFNRTTVSQLCNNTYTKEIRQGTYNVIFNVLRKDPFNMRGNIRDYLFGKIEYEDILAPFSFSLRTSVPAKASRAADMISPILAEMNFSAMLDDNRHVRIYGKTTGNKPDYVDMNESEFTRFKFFVLEQIKVACHNYVYARYAHDGLLAYKHLRSSIDPVSDLHYYPDE